MAKSRAKSKSNRKGSTDKENQPPKTSSNRLKLRSWSNDSMVQAMDAVKSGLLELLLNMEYLKRHSRTG